MKNLLIGRQWQRGMGKVFRSLNPSTEEVVWQGPATTDEEVKLAVAVARQAHERWSALSLAGRLDYLRTFVAELTRQKEPLAQAISLETGKPRWESAAEVAAMAAKLTISLEAARERQGVKACNTGAATSITRYRPQGVVAVLGPFNLPGHLPNGQILPALLAGNTIVFKPSERAPLVGERCMRIWQASGLPEGVLNMVQGGAATGRSLVRNPDIDGLFFIGGSRTGLAIHRACAGRPQLILALEMGGNNPIVVWRSSNHDAAAAIIAQSVTITAGQRCTCARRLILKKGPQGRKLLDALIEHMRKTRIGAFTEDPEPFMGPLITMGAVQKLLRKQARLRRLGGTMLLEAKPLERKGFFVSPGIVDVTDIPFPPDEEVFGPLLQVKRVADLASALGEANNTRFGLAAGLISDDAEAYTYFRKKIRAGIVNWNQPLTGASSRAPFGGVGQSGNYRPSAYFAVDYCAYPVASLESRRLVAPKDPY